MIGNTVRITSHGHEHCGRVGVVVDTVTVKKISEYTGQELTRDMYVVELTPIDREPIEEITCRPLDCTVLQLRGLKKGIKKCHLETTQ